MRRKALKCVLSEKIRQNNFICLDSTDELNGKTQSMTTLLNNLGISNSTLIITANAQENVFRAGHNVPKLWTTPVNLLNANDVLNYQTIIMTVDAAKLAEEMWADPIGHRQKRASANITTTDETRRSPEPDLTSETTPNQDAPARSRRQRQTPATQTGEETPTTTRRRRTSTAAQSDEEPAPTTRRRRTSATQSDEETPPTPRRRRTSQTEPEVEQ